MRFNCDCESNKDLLEMINEIHNDDDKHGVNWEVGARLWVSNLTETIMIEYQIMTERGKRNMESPDEPDWFTAYLVRNEEDDSTDREIDTIGVGEFTKLQELEDVMNKYANSLMQ